VGSVTTPFKTTAFSYDMQMKQKRGKAGFLAFGVNFFSDNAGDAKLRSSQGGLSVAYHIKTGQNSTIGAGLFGGFGQRSIDPSGLQWGEQYDGSAYDSALPTGESLTASSITFLDLGLGGTWHYNSAAGANDVVANQSTQATLGFGYFHVTRPEYTFLGAEEQLYAKMVLHGNARFSMGDGNSAIVPSFQYTKQGPSTEFMLGCDVPLCAHAHLQSDGHQQRLRDLPGSGAPRERRHRHRGHGRTGPFRARAEL
jgi:type IX secretion system PorP/SprF family membrane protein